MRVNLKDGPWRCARGRRLLLLFGYESRNRRLRVTSSYFTEAFMRFLRSALLGSLLISISFMFGCNGATPSPKDNFGPPKEGELKSKSGSKPITAPPGIPKDDVPPPIQKK